MCRINMFPLPSLILTLLAITLVSPTTLEEDLTLTIQQKNLLDKFKLEVSPYLYEPYMEKEIYLIRWLRATNFNLNDAQSKLIKNIQWRKENNIDSILTEDFSDIAPMVPYKILGQAKDKVPVVYWEVGRASLRKVHVSGRMPRLLRFMDKYLEEVIILTRSLNSQNVTQFDFIVNMEGVNVAQHACLGCVPGILTHFLSYENHYPGSANRMIIVNANSALGVIMEATKVAMSRRSREALEIYGVNKRIWKRRLLEFVDEDILPTQLGGTALLEFEDY